VWPPIPPADKTFLWIEAAPEIDMPLERPLWTPPITTTYGDIEPATAPLDLTASPLQALFSQFYVDESRLRRHVAALLEQKGRVTLAEVTAVYPLTQGLAELITYLAIATRDPAHHLDETEWEEVKLAENGRIVRVPLVIYEKEPRRHKEHKEEAV
jgi:hypothetical protein